MLVVVGPSQPAENVRVDEVLSTEGDRKEVGFSVMKWGIRIDFWWLPTKGK